MRGEKFMNVYKMLLRKKKSIVITVVIQKKNIYKKYLQRLIFVKAKGQCQFLCLL